MQNNLKWCFSSDGVKIVFGDEQNAISYLRIFFGKKANENRIFSLPTSDIWKMVVKICRI
jgi:hypothetical protein